MWGRYWLSPGSLVGTASRAEPAAQRTGLQGLRAGGLRGHFLCRVE
jgi:hypothetical protein